MISGFSSPTNKKAADLSLAAFVLTVIILPILPERLWSVGFHFIKLDHIGALFGLNPDDGPFAKREMPYPLPDGKGVLSLFFG